MKINKTFIIRHKKTGEIWRACSGKSSWKAKNHASSAWANSDHKDTEGIEKIIPCTWDVERLEYPKFREQDLYEVVELKPESDIKLQEACELLTECFSGLTGGCYNPELIEQIQLFLEENEI